MATKLKLMIFALALSGLVAGWSAPAAAARKPVIVVNPGDAQDLYAKLKDPATARYPLLLSGTYTLTAAGEGAATDGFLDLGDRDLVGTNIMTDSDGDGVPDPIAVSDLNGDGDSNDRVGGVWEETYVDPANETVIDGSLLGKDPAPREFVGHGGVSGTVDRPLILAAQGNLIQGITVRGMPILSSSASIEINGGSGARVTRCLIEGGDMGIWIANQGDGAAGALISAVLEGNVIRGHIRNGIFVVNFLTHDARVDAHLRGNRSLLNNGAGVSALSASSEDSTVHAVSQGNIYKGNTVGAGLSGGGDSSFPDVISVSQNRLDFTSLDDVFESNRIGLFFFGGGVKQFSHVLCKNNDANLNLLSARFKGNLLFTMLAAGATGTSNVEPGNGNHGRVLARQVSFEGGGPFVARDTLRFPSGAAATSLNELELVGNKVAWDMTTDLLPLLDQNGNGQIDPEEDFFTGLGPP
jgi:hypothetical protein